MINAIISGLTGQVLISGLTGSEYNGRLTLPSLRARLAALGASAFYLPSVYADAKPTYYGDGDVSIGSVGDPVGLVFDQLYTDRLGPERFNIANAANVSPSIAVNSTDGTITHLNTTLGTADFSAAVGSAFGWSVGQVVKVTFTVEGLSVGPAGHSFTGSFGLESAAVRLSIAQNGNFVRYMRVTDVLAPIKITFGLDSSVNAVVSGNSVRRVSGISARQITESNRPALAKAGVVPYFSATSGQSLLAAFPDTVGATCTIAYANPLTGEAVITTGVNIGTTYSMTQSHSGLAIFPRALNADETAQVTALFTKLARTVAV